MKATGKIVEVERNEAHDLIDQDKAEIVTPKAPTKQRQYLNRQMNTSSRQMKTK